MSQAVVPPEQQPNFTATFAPGGAFSARADCNTVNGTWAATSSGGLTITLGPSTIVACEKGSNSDLYIMALTEVRSYTQASNQLTVTLADGGSLSYVPGVAPR